MSAYPNFIVVGAPKCGTTSLWYELKNHPNIFMTDDKEPAFFNKEENIFRGKKDEGWNEYLARFSEGEGCAAIGEATPGYAMVERDPDIPARIAEALPEARLIYVVRHPLRRIESAWRQNVLRGRIPPDTFKDALWNYAPILSGSKYFRTLSAYRECFPDEQILLLFLEDLSERPVETLNKCFRFLAVEPISDQLGRGEPKNESKDHQFTMPLFKRLKRRQWLWNFGKSLVPERAKSYVMDLFHQPLPSPDWDEKTLAWAVNQVGEDARRTLEYGGKSPQFWQFPAEVAG